MSNFEYLKLQLEDSQNLSEVQLIELSNIIQQLIANQYQLGVLND